MVDQTDVRVHSSYWLEGAEFTHGLRFPKGLIDQRDLSNICLRFACHFLLNQIPPEGLRSLSQNLLEYVDFYAVPPNPPRQLPPVFPTYQTTELLGTHERPVFTVEED